ncbi:isoleucine--tRNA ligase [Coelomomyces lativittatus]|nr:isoleucine--tRNA ligase [Coelomomyces lativittatus]
MQRLIELGRCLRDRHTLSLKTPVHALVVVVAPHEEEVLHDLQSLHVYIEEELNVKHITYSTDEPKYHVQYKVVADFRALGHQLRHAMPKVKHALANLPPSAIQQFLTSGTLEVLEGIHLSSNEISVSKAYVNPNPHHDRWAATSDPEMTVLMDVVTHTDAMEQERWARELVNRIQRLRKKAGLVPTEERVAYYYVLMDNTSRPPTSSSSSTEVTPPTTPHPFISALKSMEPYLLKTLKRPLLVLDEKKKQRWLEEDHEAQTQGSSPTTMEASSSSSGPPSLDEEKFLISEDQEINGWEFKLLFFWEPTTSP